MPKANKPPRPRASSAGLLSGPSNSTGGRSTEKPHARNADPGVIAGEILVDLTVDGLPRIRYWAGSWWQWSRGRYAELPEGELRALVMGHLKRGWSHVKRSHVADVLEHIRAETILRSDVSPPTWLGAEPNGFAAKDCLATANNIVHLPSLAAGQGVHSIAATPNFFTLNACAFELDPSAPPPEKWLRFLGQIWPDDQESIDTLQELFGYLLAADTQFQKIFGLIGPSRSGKGTIVRVLRKIVGELNVAGPTLSSLATNFGLSPLVGKTLAVVSDARLSSRADLAVVVERLLAISGEDKLTIDRKFTSAIDCQLPTRFLILSNELPRLPDASGTIVNRFVMLRTSQSFLGREDTSLERKLIDELPGILLWAIEGRRRLLERGHFVQPVSGQEMLESMTDLASPVSAFVRARCDLSPSAQCPKRDLYEAYKDWAGSQGIDHKLTSEVFGRDLVAAFPQVRTQRIRTGNGNEREYCYTGLNLSENVSDDGVSF